MAGEKVMVCIDTQDLPFMPSSKNGGSFLAYLSFCLMTASIFGLYLTIITHLVFSELHNLPGLNLLAMSTNMVLYQQLFLAPAKSGNLCTAIAISLHFLILSTFFWTNVMAYDLYKTFGQCKAVETNIFF